MILTKDYLLVWRKALVNDLRRLWGGYELPDEP